MSLKTILATAVALTLSAGAASAAVLDFVQEANNNERGVTDGTEIIMNGVNVTFTSSHFAYFDHGGAGLGVCKYVANPGATSNNGEGNQCNTDIPNPASDDNVTSTESVTISFDYAMTLSNLLFNQEGHAPFSDSATALQKTLLFGINDGTLVRYTFAQLQSMSFSDVISATFAFDDATFWNDADFNGLSAASEQFYLAAATVVPVPLPAAGLMLLAGLGALGAARRRRG